MTPRALIIRRVATLCIKQYGECIDSPLVYRRSHSLGSGSHCDNSGQQPVELQQRMRQLEKGGGFRERSISAWLRHGLVVEKDKLITASVKQVCSSGTLLILCNMPCQSSNVFFISVYTNHYNINCYVRSRIDPNLLRETWLPFGTIRLLQVVGINHATINYLIL